MPRRRKLKPKVQKIELQDYDIGTAELHSKEVVEVYGMQRKRRARILSSPIDYYFARDFINKDQHNAGSQFYKLWYHGGGKPKYASMDLLRVPGISDGDYSSSMREKYRAALEAFTSPVHRHIVYEVVCVGEYADSAMRRAIRDGIQGATNYKKRMDHLRKGLDELVSHFARRRRSIDILAAQR